MIHPMRSLLYYKERFFIFLSLLLQVKRYSYHFSTVFFMEKYKLKKYGYDFSKSFRNFALKKLFKPSVPPIHLS